ncbi:ubiquitin carboxyl-terminal hydrolase (UBP14) [Vairimorpha necatrix]|uniref:Ubiquitin carboxyl-terminal hydrolase (UBP14) n=1 Tax=Vairimorpha necatrix TaxID=6039 RepID=A0AAX4JC16_9MICR
MEKLKLYKFRETCSCCFLNVKSGINVCKCQISFCDKHFDVHTNKSSCSLLYRVHDQDTLHIQASDLNNEEKQKALEKLKLILKCNNYDEKVIFKTDEVECHHILHISVHDKIQIDKLKNLKCNDCEVTKNLYICFTCGFIGCGRVQFGIEGNGHAKHHYNVTDHCIFVLISSITPEYICDTFCYKCDEFIVNPICEAKIECVEFFTTDASETDKKVVVEESVNEDPSPFLGIKNAGNTCFISSSLQLIGLIASKEDLDFEKHFEICEENNPLNCIYCQACKIFNEMKIKRKSMDCKSISIPDMLVLIWRRFPFFEKNVQEDASEFLLAFLNLLSEAESIGLFPKISQFFKLKTESQTSCNSCKSSRVNEEEQFALFLPFKQSLQSCVENYFKDHTGVCSCGNEQIVSNKILSLPKYLLVSVKKFKYENQVCTKICDSLSVDEVNLVKFIKRPSISNYFIQELISKGFKEGEILLSLSSNVDFDNKEELIREYSESYRTNPVYNVQGSIVHTGTSFNAGHYMWFVKNKDVFYLVNDRKISEERVEWFEQSYVICLY